MPKNATVTITTIVVDITSSRDGQLTCFISSRTSCRKDRNRRGYSAIFPTGDSRENPLTRCSDSSLFNFAACAISRAACVLVAIGRFAQPAKLAGEEGFEPPLSVLETDGLPLKLLPYRIRFTSLPCGPCAYGTPCKISSFPSGRNASSDS